MKKVSLLFGKRVAELRKEKHLSQEKLAHAGGLNRTYVGAVERGEKSPTLDTIEKIAAGLGVSVREIFASEDFN